MGAGESVACNWDATCAGRVRRRALASSAWRPVDAPRAVPGTVDSRVSACSDGGDGYGGNHAMVVLRMRHLSACSTSPCASGGEARLRRLASRPRQRPSSW